MYSFNDDFIEKLEETVVDIRELECQRRTAIGKLEILNAILQQQIKEL